MGFVAVRRRAGRAELHRVLRTGLERHDRSEIDVDPFDRRTRGRSIAGNAAGADGRGGDGMADQQLATGVLHLDDQWSRVRAVAAKPEPDAVHPPGWPVDSEDLPDPVSAAHHRIVVGIPPSAGADLDPVAVADRNI